MKKSKIIIPIIIAVLAIGIIAIVAIMGNNKPQQLQTGAKGDNTKTQEQEEKKAKEVSLGKTIELSFIKMSLDKIEVKPEYKFSYKEKTSWGSTTHSSSITCKSGMKLVCLKGKLTNLSKEGVYTSNDFVKGEIVINGNKYKTRLECVNESKAEKYYELVAQQSSNYYLYAEVPEKVANELKSCTVNFGFVENLESKYISDLSELDYLYTLTYSK